MKIEEIKEAKIKLEHEIEVSLIEFEKKFGLSIKSVAHSKSEVQNVEHNGDTIWHHISSFHCIKLKIEI